MIGGVTRHGRTSRDAKKLAAHLLKEPGVVVRIANSIAPDLPSALQDMLLARDGSRADSAFLHLHISPARKMTEAELRKAAMIVLRHFDAADHPAVFVIHEKKRIGGDGGAHAHVVLGRVGPDGTVLPSGFEVIRMETAMRIVEFELGEPATLGRHHASASRWLRQHGREDVADWLEAAHGRDPEKPRSPATPQKRQAMERKGTQFPEARAAILAAWTSAKDQESFRESLSASGLTVVTGTKPEVWIVRHGNVEVGALDRIVRRKRAEVSSFMSAQRAAPKPRPQRPAVKPLASSRQMDLPRNLTEIDLDEIRWRSERYGRETLDTLNGRERRQRLMDQIRAETALPSTKGGSGKPADYPRTRRPGYDVTEETPQLRPRLGGL